jgi:CubicO group peptidase (beta-lactamase class C family)
MTRTTLAAMTAASLLATIGSTTMTTSATPRLTSASAAAAAAPASPAAGNFAKLDEFFTRVAADVPRGLEVLILQDGREVYAKQFGGWRRDTQAPIASASKWLSAAVIMSLVDDGRLSLDDRASRYLPYLTGDKAAITIRQLMSHTAGFPGEFPLAHRCLGDPADTLEHCAQSLAAVPLRAQPGTAFIYAGAGMQIAGRVAEVAAGKDWQTLFRERIAEPLGLTATDYQYEGPTRNPRISGGGRSTVRDYMTFLTMVAQRGEYRGRRVLSAHAVDDMLRDQTGGVPIVESPFQRGAVRDPRSAANRYGIGNWLEEPDANGRSTWHSSPGALGWTPLIDTSRHLQVVVGVWAVRKFQPHYGEMKALLRELFPADAPSGAPAGATAPPTPTLLPAVYRPGVPPKAARVQAGQVGQAGQMGQLGPEQLEKAQERLKEIEERLALTPDQKEQLRPVLVDELQQLKALREKHQDDDGGRASRRDRRKMAKDFRHVQSETDKKLRAILSETQMAEMKKIREEWRQQLRERAKAR